MPSTPIRDLAIDHERSGSGPTLIWGHGLTSSRADEAIAPVLVDWGRVTETIDVVRYDAVGHGRSEATTELDRYRWDELARDQQALAEHYGIGPAVVGGASMGAATALHRAVQYPESVLALVLVIPPTGWSTRAAQADNYRRMADLIEAGAIETVLAAGRQMAPPDPFVDLDHWHDRSARRLRAFESERLAGLFRGAAEADLPAPDALAAIEVPTLILAWTGDPGHPVETADRLATLLPNTECHVAETMAEIETWTDRVIGFVAGPATPAG